MDGHKTCCKAANGRRRAAVSLSQPVTVQVQLTQPRRFGRRLWLCCLGACYSSFLLSSSFPDHDFNLNSSHHPAWNHKTFSSPPASVEHRIPFSTLPQLKLEACSQLSYEAFALFLFLFFFCNFSSFLNHPQPAGEESFVFFSDETGVSPGGTTVLLVDSSRLYFAFFPYFFLAYIFNVCPLRLASRPARSSVIVYGVRLVRLLLRGRD